MWSSSKLALLALPIRIRLTSSIICLVIPRKFNSFDCVGSEGMEAITHINVSKDGKLVSICERNVEGEKGRVTIYEIISSKKRQHLPDAPDQSNRFKSQEFVCSAFSTRKEEILVTLCGAPDWQILLWDWEKCRLLGTCSVGLNVPQSLKNRIF